MSILDSPPKLINANWQQWAQRTATWLAKTRSTLRHKVSGESAAENGVLLWDEVNNVVVVSRNGQYEAMLINMDYAEYSDSTSQSIAAINTAQAITFNTAEVEHGISIGTPTSRIVVSENGVYQVAPSLQITSSSASTKTAYCWIRENGVDVPRSRIDVTISGSSATLILTTTFLVTALANDYIEIMFASNSTGVRIDARAATAFAPAAPSAILEITQLHL